MTLRNRTRFQHSCSAQQNHMHIVFNFVDFVVLFVCLFGTRYNLQLLLPKFNIWDHAFLLVVFLVGRRER